MQYAGCSIYVSGCDSITKKNLKLYRGQYPGVQLFFDPEPGSGCDLRVVPAENLDNCLSEMRSASSAYFSVIGYGPADAMGAAIASGCSDYLCSPWTAREFYERALMCFRNSMISLGTGRLYCGNDGVPGILSVDSAIIYADECLSRSELIIFTALRKNRGDYVSRSLLSELLEKGSAADSRAVDMHVSRLRRKINNLIKKAGADDLCAPIKTATGYGWGIDPAI